MERQSSQNDFNNNLILDSAAGGPTFIGVTFLVCAVPIYYDLICPPEVSTIVVIVVPKIIGHPSRAAHVPGKLFFPLYYLVYSLQIYILLFQRLLVKEGVCVLTLFVSSRF